MSVVIDETWIGLIVQLVKLFVQFQHIVAHQREETCSKLWWTLEHGNSWTNCVGEVCHFSAIDPLMRALTVGGRNKV